MAAPVILLLCYLSLHSVFDVGDAVFPWPRNIPKSSALWRRFFDRFRPTEPPTTTSQPTTTTARTTTPQTAIPVHDSVAPGLCDTKEFSNSLSCRLEREYPDVQQELLNRFGEKLFLEPDRQPAGGDGAGKRSCAKGKTPVLHDKKGDKLNVNLGLPDLECEFKPVLPGIDPMSEKPGVSQPDPEAAFNPCGYSANMVSPIHAVTVSGETVELWAGTQGGVIKQQKFREVKCTSSTPNHQGCEGRCVEEPTWHRAIVVKSGSPPSVGWDMIVVKASCSCHVVTSRSLFKLDDKMSRLDDAELREKVEDPAEIIETS